MPTRQHLAATILGLALAGGTAIALTGARPVTAAPDRTPVRAAITPPAATPAARPTPASAPAPDPAAYTVKRILQIPGPMRQGDHYWDETGAPPGPVVVTVDLAAQTVSVFRAGYEIGTAVIIYGADEKPTPLGVFPITQKDAHHVSNIYNAPMPYMLRLTNDGISIHGSDVGDGYVTHGCIGVPKAFAKRIFDAVKLGDRVIVTRGEMLDLGQPITAA